MTSEVLRSGPNSGPSGTFGPLSWIALHRAKVGLQGRRSPDATGGLDCRQSAPPARYLLPRAPTRRGADHAKSTRLRCAACRLPFAGEELDGVAPGRFGEPPGRAAAHVARIAFVDERGQELRLL